MFEIRVVDIKGYLRDTIVEIQSGGCSRKRDVRDKEW